MQSIKLGYAQLLMEWSLKLVKPFPSISPMVHMSSHIGSRKKHTTYNYMHIYTKLNIKFNINNTQHIKYCIKTLS